MIRSSRSLLRAGVVACAALLAACGGSSSSNPAPQPPAAPTSLTATPANSSVALGWIAPSGATSFKVYRSTSTGALSTKTFVAEVTSGTAYNDAATNGTKYYYQVTALNAAGESAGSNEASATPLGSLAPAVPLGVTATPSKGQVTVAWTAVPGAATYNVYYGTTSPVTTSSTSITGVTSSPFTLPGLADGTQYYFAVTAVAGGLESALSAEVSATPNLAPPYIEATVIRWEGGVAPTAPVVQVKVCTDFTCGVGVDSTYATVTLNTASVPFVGGPNDFESTQSIAAGATVSLSVVVTSGGPVAAGTYTASGTMYSTAPTVTAPTSGDTWYRGGDYHVTWTAGAPTSTTLASIYVIGLQDNAGTFYPANAAGDASSAPITASSFSVPGGSLPAGTLTAFVGIGTAGIVGSTGSGISISSAAAGSGLYLGLCSALTTFTVSSALPSAPTTLAAKGADQSVHLTWNSSNDATGYDVYRSTSTGAIGTKTKINASPVTATAYADTTAANGTTYYYQVVATNGNGDSAASNQASATPGPAPFIDAKGIRWSMPMVTGVPVQEVRICTDSTCATSVSTATVQLNSTFLAWNSSRNQYEGNAMPTASGTLTLKVTIPDGDLVASGVYSASIATYASAPTVTTNATWSRAAANDITWTGGSPTATTPASGWVIGIQDSTGTFYPVKSKTGPTEAPLGSTTWTLAAGTLPAAGAYTVWVGLATAGIIDGGGGVSIPGAAAGSGLYTGYGSSYVTVTVTD